MLLAAGGECSPFSYRAGRSANVTSSGSAIKQRSGEQNIGKENDLDLQGRGRLFLRLVIH